MNKLYYSILSAGACEAKTGKQQANQPVAGNSGEIVTVLCSGAEVIFLLQELYLQWLNSPKTITVLLTVNLSRRCSVYFRAMCCGAVIHIIVFVGRTNGSALLKLTDIFNYSVGTSASSTSGRYHRVKALLPFLVLSIDFHCLL